MTYVSLIKVIDTNVCDFLFSFDQSTLPRQLIQLPFFHFGLAELLDSAWQDQGASNNA
jgi:hypothetical protein